ncbi:MAG TPA: Rieske 2Fe-2S domain-containing protein [Acidimicrobiales bacterium]
MGDGHKRFPFRNDPFSWYGVGYVDDWEPGDVKPAHWLGRELVVWRDHAGGFHVQDAYCPHLGAHLGVGGTVTDESCIKCPFHGWEFDAAGACARVPYSDRLNKKARVRTYPTRDHAGIVWMWWHPEGAEPMFDLPAIPEYHDPEFTDYVYRSWTISSVLQEMGENSADPAHFRYVHGTDTVPEVDRYEVDGYTWKIWTSQKFVTPRGVTDARIDVESYGRGVSITRFAGIIDTTLVAWQTPVDEDRTTVNFAFRTRKLADEKMTSTVADAFVAELSKQITEDIPIWENKAYLPVPALAAEDGPVMEYRKWCKQFYTEAQLTES